MEPSSFNETTPTSTQPGLRKARSTSTLRKRPKRISLLVKRFVTECNSILTKLKSLSDTVLTEDEDVADLFQVTDAEFFLHKQGSGGLTKAERQFLSDYKNHKSLDAIVMHYQKIESAETNSSVEDSGKMTYKDLDVTRLRQKMETKDNSAQLASDLSTESSQEPDDLKNQNVGEFLWDYRRTLWLEHDKDSVEEKLQNSDTHVAMENIPPSSYSKIYMNFIEKSKPLKDGKRFKLKDLIDIINAGWVHDQRWERAAKGLA
ncbi:hypothetical protein EJF18_10162 [Clavispora lusitaniae]|uniref:Gag1-like clamp domain-containing protein n=2 Tax=Clavispora lusitaniae TaxID=36911 RepID=C4XW22_CLAL4|nr:uncharacterized protein CLUG_00145 [Clavispora lusitaniae ATCC 42720]KAF5213430.1 hypothetical protein E0198_000951 [Clavispora lusitaniae]EEQ36022.1 hypothetical protein CLUG_00145 [Clavispora lusitaniae ATCC 42720]QFZ25077.1 hypothetical protein EJF14_10162 [Clavispora lusitaniae]QFZ31620.1 hypothetical protein EJF16_10162 [Clavispora lusitaniae]QFZ37288.1 hypothetical protein EJF15_10162 [Clavispora lusitaniae]